MKNAILLLFMCSAISVSAQSVSGKLTLNGKTKANLELETNSAVQLFKEFKTGKYKLAFDFETKDISKNIYNETIVFFDFITVIKKDGKLVKKIQRKQPMVYFPGEQAIPVEAFDFIGALGTFSEDEVQALVIEKGYQGTMPGGEYTVELMVKPVDFKGDITPLAFSFALRKRPGRAKY